MGRLFAQVNPDIATSGDLGQLTARHESPPQNTRRQQQM